MEKEVVNQTVTETEQTQVIPQETEVVKVTTEETRVEEKDDKDLVKKQLTETVKQLSSEFKLNLFDKEGVIKLAEQIKAERVANEKLTKQIEALSEEKKGLIGKEQEFTNKITALELGFSSDKITEALALASVNIKEGQTLADGLKVVKEKYGGMLLVNPSAGIIHSDAVRKQEEAAKSEFEKYAQKNPRYQKFYNKK